MENMVIQGTELQIKEYRGKRVVTFKDIDAVHQRPDGTAHRNFKANRQRFISGVDFFNISAKDVGTNFVQTYGFNNKAPNGTLITESGYLMLVKSFTDDLAWKVQRELVDAYFRVKDETVDSVSAVMIDTDKLIRCAEIMAGCLEGNRPYVLNILRNIIPNVEEAQAVDTEQKGTGLTVPDVSVKTVVTVTQDKTSNKGYGVPFNFHKFDRYLLDNHIKSVWLAQELGVAVKYISNWRSGNTSPGEVYRARLCQVLGVSDGYFNGRTRRRKE